MAVEEQRVAQLLEASLDPRKNRDGTFPASHVTVELR
jgi:hypothetical protein